MKAPRFNPPANAEFFWGTDKESLEEIPFFAVTEDDGVEFFDSAGVKLLRGRPFNLAWSPVMSRAAWDAKVNEKAPRFNPPVGSKFEVGSDADEGTPRFNIWVPAELGRFKLVGPDGEATKVAYLSREVSESEFWSAVEGAAREIS